MKPNKNKKQTGKKKQTLKEKVREHIHDRNHVITDEDIREVVIGPEAVNLDAEREGHPEERVDRAARKMEKEIPDKKKTTPWDLLNE